MLPSRVLPPLTASEERAFPPIEDFVESVVYYHQAVFKREFEGVKYRLGFAGLWTDPTTLELDLSIGFKAFMKVKINGRHRDATAELYFLTPCCQVEATRKDEEDGSYYYACSGCDEDPAIPTSQVVVIDCANAKTAVESLHQWLKPHEDPLRSLLLAHDLVEVLSDFAGEAGDIYLSLYHSRPHHLRTESLQAAQAHVLGLFNESHGKG